MTDKFLVDMDVATTIDDAIFYGEQDNTPKQFAASLFSAAGSSFDVDSILIFTDIGLVGYPDLVTQNGNLMTFT